MKKSVKLNGVTVTADNGKLSFEIPMNMNGARFVSFRQTHADAIELLRAASEETPEPKIRHLTKIEKGLYQMFVKSTRGIIKPVEIWQRETVREYGRSVWAVIFRGREIEQGTFKFCRNFALNHDFKF